MSRPQVAVLSADDRFARLLQLELEAWQLTVRTGQKADSDGAEVAIVDLDSAEIPTGGNYGYLIGFSRLPALSADADARRCAMILRRPFRMSLLRQEVLAHLSVRAAVPGGGTEKATAGDSFADRKRFGMRDCDSPADPDRAADGGAVAGSQRGGSHKRGTGSRDRQPVGGWDCGLYLRNPKKAARGWNRDNG